MQTSVDDFRSTSEIINHEINGTASMLVAEIFFFPYRNDFHTYQSRVTWYEGTVVSTIFDRKVQRILEFFFFRNVKLQIVYVEQMDVCSDNLFSIYSIFMSLLPDSSR